jgi:hypothetical protein
MRRLRYFRNESVDAELYPMESKACWVACLSLVPKVLGFIMPCSRAGPAPASHLVLKVVEFRIVV